MVAARIGQVKRWEEFLSLCLECLGVDPREATVGVVLLEVQDDEEIVSDITGERFPRTHGMATK